MLDANERPIAELTYTEYVLGKRDGWIRDGMIPKLQTGFESLFSGVASVRIGSPRGFQSGISTQLMGES